MNKLLKEIDGFLNLLQSHSSHPINYKLLLKQYLEGENVPEEVEVFRDDFRYYLYNFEIRVRALRDILNNVVLDSIENKKDLLEIKISDIDDEYEEFFI